MLLFHEFKSLPRRFQSLATQFWAQEIMHLAKVDNVNQLPNEIELLAGIEGYALKKRRQKYWYKKIKGEPIGNTNELDLIEKIFDNSSNVLLSPIWQLLATKDQPLNDLIILSKRLPSKQRDLLFNSEGKPDVSKFSMAECGIYNDLDSIMLIFIVHLLSKSIVPHYDEVKNEQFMIRKIIFLYNSRYNTYKYRFKSTLQLCQYFSVFFSSELSNTQNKSITFINVEEQKFEILNSIPQKLSQLSSKDIIEVCCSIYIKIHVLLNERQCCGMSFSFFILSTIEQNDLSDFVKNLYRKPIKLGQIEKILEKLKQRELSKFGLK